MSQQRTLPNARSRRIGSEQLREFAVKAGSLPDVIGLSEEPESVRVDFHESEFIVQFHLNSVDATCKVTITVVVRAEPPDLRTWWRDWTVTVPSTESAREAVARIQQERAHIKGRFASGTMLGFV